MVVGKIKYRTKESVVVHTNKPTGDNGAYGALKLPSKFSYLEAIASRFNKESGYIITHKTKMRQVLNKYLKNLIFLEDIVSGQCDTIINCSGVDIHFQVIRNVGLNGVIPSPIKTHKRNRFRSILELSKAHSEGKLIVMHDRYSRGWDKYIGDKYVHVKDFV